MHCLCRRFQEISIPELLPFEEHSNYLPFPQKLKKTVVIGIYLWPSI
jgi:hypothetical protein